MTNIWLATIIPIFQHHFIESEKKKAKKKAFTNLVGGWPTPLKSMKISWSYDIPNIWKVIIQSCSSHQPVIINHY